MASIDATVPPQPWQETIQTPTTPSSQYGGNQNVADSPTKRMLELEEDSSRLPKTDAPDGGLRAWSVVLGAWCASFCSFGWIWSMGAFQEYYQTDMLRGHSPSTIAWITSTQSFFVMFMGPIVGGIADRRGPHELLFIGSFLHVFGIMMSSLADKYYQVLLAQGVCSGIGSAAIFLCSLNVVHAWFEAKRATAFGILATGTSFGGVILPIMVRHMIREVGYGWAMRACAFIILALLIVANLTVRNLHPPNPQKLTKEQLVNPFRDFDFMTLVFGFFCYTFGLWVPYNYVPLHALDAGMDPNLAQYLVPIMNATSLVGRIGAGILGDRIGPYNIFAIVCYASALSIFCVWIPAETDGGIIAFTALFGCFSGGYISLLGPVVRAITPFEEIGWRGGLAFFFSSFASLTTNPINGAIIRGPGGWPGVKAFAGVFCFAGTTFVYIVKLRKTGWKVGAKF